MPSWIASLLGALVPEPYRTQIVERHGGDPPRASMLLGAAQFLLGVKFAHDNAMATLFAGSAELTSAFAAAAESRNVTTDDAIALNWGGILIGLGWLMRPATWLLLSIPLVGLVRAIAYLGTREAVAEPAVWAGTRLWELLRGITADARERAAFGEASAPDEVYAVNETSLDVFTARPRPEWNELVTIEAAGRFYRVAAHEETTERAGVRRHRYRLVEAGEHEVIRRLLRYELPPAPASPRGRPA